MNAEAWYLLACRSRTLVHQASMLMGALTHPGQADDAPELSAFAAQAGSGVEALLEALATAPELAACTWRRFARANPRACT